MENWSKLTAQQKAKIIQFAISNGVSNIQDIRDTYNLYARDTLANKDYDMAAARTAGFVADDRNHYDNRFKKSNHPTFGDESIYHSEETPGGHWSRGTNAGQWSYEPTDYVLNQQGGWNRFIERFKGQEGNDAYVNTVPVFRGGVMLPEVTVTPEYKDGGKIRIDPSKKGTFTAAATKHGKSVQEFARQVLANKDNYSPALVKKAVFAHNSKSWNHSNGGQLFHKHDQETPESTSDSNNGYLNLITPVLSNDATHIEEPVYVEPISYTFPQAYLDNVEIRHLQPSIEDYNQWKKAQEDYIKNQKTFQTPSVSYSKEWSENEVKRRNYTKQKAQFADAAISNSILAASNIKVPTTDEGKAAIVDFSRDRGLEPFMITSMIAQPFTTAVTLGAGHLGGIGFQKLNKKLDRPLTDDQAYILGNLVGSFAGGQGANQFSSNLITKYPGIRQRAIEGLMRQSSAQVPDITQYISLLKTNKDARKYILTGQLSEGQTPISIFGPYQGLFGDVEIPYNRDYISALLYGTDLDDRIATKIAIGRDFGPALEKYIGINYADKASRIPVYQLKNPHMGTKRVPKEQIKNIKNIQSGDYLFGRSMDDAFIPDDLPGYINVGGYSNNMGVLDGTKVIQGTDIYKFNAGNYTKKWLTGIGGVPPILRPFYKLGLNFIDKHTIPVVTKTAWGKVPTLSTGGPLYPFSFSKNPYFKTPIVRYGNGGLLSHKFVGTV